MDGFFLPGPNLKLQHPKLLQVLFLGTWWSKSDGILYGETAEALDMLGKVRRTFLLSQMYSDNIDDKGVLVT